MDFFQSQETARKKTGLLVVYFLLAVVLIVAAVYLVVAGLFVYGQKRPPGGPNVDLSRLWDPTLFLGVAAGTVSLITGGSLYRIASLSGGGHTVADLLGGRLLNGETADPEERKLLNVVEEMAIASGVPVPPVYLLEKESGINAFAAGYAPGDAVIGVTRGAVRHLSRDELQGVIAHEFSHVLNGDMKLNIRLMGILYGILLIALTGWLILRSTTGVQLRARDDDDDKKGGNPLPLLGLGLLIIGYVGVFFGNLIKSAVSRQREYLADASAVQFTRNPEGIAGALKKIGALSQGARVENPHAAEASHMFFGNAMGSSLFNLFATHPPLADRIRRIDPSFDGNFAEVRLDDPTDVPAVDQAPPARPAPAARFDRMPFNPAQAVATIGAPRPEGLAFASALVGSLPPDVSDLVRQPFGARVAVYALLLDPAEDVRRQQLDLLRQQVDPTTYRETLRAFPAVGHLAPEARLPLVELALPALRQLSEAQFRDFVRQVQGLVMADQQVSLFEYSLQRLLLRHLASQFGLIKPAPVTHRTIAPLTEPTGRLLSALARAGSPNDPTAAARAYLAGAEAVGWGSALPGMDAESVGLPAIDTALSILSAAALPLKKQVLEGCAACIGADGVVTVNEAELLRAISDSLDCPMPPILTHAEEPS